MGSQSLLLAQPRPAATGACSLDITTNRNQRNGSDALRDVGHAPMRNDHSPRMAPPLRHGRLPSCSFDRRPQKCACSHRHLCAENRSEGHELLVWSIAGRWKSSWLGAKCRREVTAAPPWLVSLSRVACLPVCLFIVPNQHRFDAPAPSARSSRSRRTREEPMSHGSFQRQFLAPPQVGPSNHRSQQAEAVRSSSLSNSSVRHGLMTG